MKRLIYILLVLVAAGCVDDTPGNGRQDGVIITLQLPQPQTRATEVGLDNYNENALKKFDVFFYDDQGGICYFEPEPAQIVINEEQQFVQVTVPSEEREVFDRNLTLYVVVNSPVTITAAGKSLAQLKQTVVTNATTLNPQPFAAQASFLMTGTIENLLIPKGQDLQFEQLLLDRVASKHRVKLADVAVEGYTPVKAEVRLSNYLDKGYLDTERGYYEPIATDYKTSGWRETALPNTSFTTAPFYSYPNDWESSPGQESFLTVAVDWRKNGETATQRYYYKIPLEGIPANHADGKTKRIRSNSIYDFDVQIHILGGEEPEKAVELKPMITLKDWRDEQVVVIMNEFDYLLLEKRLIEMYNVSTSQITFACNYDVDITIDQVYYYRYETNGGITTVPRGSYDQFYPKITADQNARIIKIDCKVPDNYVPTYINFTVTAQTSGLWQKATAVVYPRQYITSEKSTGSVGAEIGYDWPLENENFYTVTTLALDPSDGFVLGDATVSSPNWPVSGRTYNITALDETANNVVSPQFVIASQRGAVEPQGPPQLNFQRAAHRCATYYEGPYPAGSWRVPTVAELLLLQKLQGDYNSAIKDLFVKNSASPFSWWSARRDNLTSGAWGYGDGYRVYYVDVDQVNTAARSSSFPVTDSFGGPSNAVRCVHDTWRDTN